MHRTHSAFLDELTFFTFRDEEYHIPENNLTVIAQVLLNSLSVLWDWSTKNIISIACMKAKIAAIQETYDIT